MRRRTSTRWGLIAALTAVAALVVSPGATSASYTIVPGGAAVTVSVSSAGGTSTASFAGTAGQRVSLDMTNVTITSTKVSIIKPGGTNLVTPFTVTRSGSFLDVQTLPTTGTYRIVVDPKYTYTGSMRLRLYDVPADPPPAPITADGTPVTVTTDTPGQNASLTFSGTSGQRVSLDLNSVTYASGRLRILNPDASPLFAGSLSFGPGGRFMEPKTLPQTGIYTVVIDPRFATTGTATAQLFTVPADPSNPITACAALPCTPTTVTTTAPGQNAYLTFTGTVGDRISLLAGNSTYAGFVKVSVLKPDSTSLSSVLSAGGTDAFADTQTLPSSGTYQILVDPQFADVGSLDVQLYTVPADQTGPITLGTPLTATTTMPGQNGVYTFSGVMNQRISINLANVTYDSAKVSILKPDLTQLAPPLYVPNTVGSFLEPLKLPVTGTYTVKVDPQGPSTGSLDVALYVVPADFTGTLSAGVAKTVQITAPGQNATLTYSGTNGQRIFVTVTNVSVGDSECCGAKLQVLKPDGTSLQTSKTFGTLGTYVDTKQLTQNGNYKVKIDPIDELTGNLDVTLYLVPADATATSGALTANGTPVDVTTTAPGQSGRVSFSGTATGRFAFKLVSFGSGFCPVKISVLRPDNTTFIGPTCSPDDSWFDTKTLGATGAFKIVVDPQGMLTGKASLVLYSVPADFVTTLGGSGVTLSPGQNAYLSFTGTGGQTATVTPNMGGTIALARASLVKSDKTSQLAGGAEYWDPASSGTPVASSLPTTGTYYLKFDPIGGASGTSMTFSLSFS